MRQISPNDSIATCRNCNSPLPPASSYCPNCSQRFTTGKINFKDFVIELIDNFFSLDSRWFKTLKYILLPGKLTKEFFLGKHRSYIHPIRIFLVVVGLFLYVFSQKMLESYEFSDNDSFKVNLYKNLILNDLDSSYVSEAKLNPDFRQKLNSLLFKISEINTNKLIYKEEEKKEKKQKEPIVKVNANIKKLDSLKQARRQDSIFYLKTNKTIYALPVEEFKKTKVDYFVEKYNIQVDTPYKLLIASLRKVKHNEEYEDTLHIEKIISAEDTLSFLTDWSNPLEISISLSNNQNQIALEDIRKLSINQITEKYHIGNFLDKLILKQMIKSNLDNKSFINFLIGTILWILIVFIPFMALIMKVFYWRSKVYLVEHIVFLLHYHIAVLITLTIALLTDDTAIQGFVWTVFCIYSFFVLPYYGIKNFYRQSWTKTIFKASSIGFIYFCSLFVFLLIGLIIGFFVY